MESGASWNDYEEYKMKISRLTHLETLLLTFYGVFMAAFYFVLKEHPALGLIQLVSSATILALLSFGYIHLVNLASTYAISIIEKEKALRISHIAEKWIAYGKELHWTFKIIVYSPAFLTIVAIIIMILNGFQWQKLILGCLLIAAYAYSIARLGIGPCKKLFESIDRSLQKYSGGQKTDSNQPQVHSRGS